MPEYIEREALINAVGDIIEDYKQEKTFSCDFAANVLKDIVDNIVRPQPAANVVEVVRCYKCKYWAGGSCINKDGLFRPTLGGQFCSAGKRKDGADNDR